MHIDGQYKGLSELGRGSLHRTETCDPNPVETSNAVTNRGLSYTWSPQLQKIRVNARVSPDGSLDGSESYAVSPEYERKYLTIRGTISDRKMDLLGTGPGCSRHLLLERKN